MKKHLAFVLLSGCVALTCYGQASSVSKNLQFNAGNSSQNISGISTPLNFDASNPKAASGKSSLLFNPNQNGIQPSKPVVVVKEKKTEQKPPVETAVAEVTKQTTPVQNETLISMEQPLAEVVAQHSENRAVETALPLSTVTLEATVNPTSPKSVLLGSEFATNLPKYKALIIGVSEYQFAGAGLPSLENPSKDAQKLHDLLVKKYTFDPEDIRLLTNPTRREIIDALELVSSEITTKDNLLVFYAGHGYYDKSKDFGYWLPSDAKSASRVDWIPNSTIKDYLSAINSKHTLLISDGCFAGSIFKTRAVDANTILKIHEVYKDPSRKAITSGSLTVVPDKSIFLEYLLRKLEENEDDFLSSQKLFSRMYEPISNNSLATPQYGVVQGTGDEGGDFIFIKRQ